MRERPKFSEFEIAILETKILLDCITDKIFLACETIGSAQSRLTSQLMLELQRRVEGLHAGSDGFGHGRAQW